MGEEVGAPVGAVAVGAIDPYGASNSATRDLGCEGGGLRALLVGGPLGASGFGALGGNGVHAPVGGVRLFEVAIGSGTSADAGSALLLAAPLSGDAAAARWLSGATVGRVGTPVAEGVASGTRPRAQVGLALDQGRRGIRISGAP